MKNSFVKMKNHQGIRLTFFCISYSLYICGSSSSQLHIFRGKRFFLLHKQQTGTSVLGCGCSDEKNNNKIRKMYLTTYVYAVCYSKTQESTK